MKFILLTIATWTRGSESLRKSAPQSPDVAVSKELAKFIEVDNREAAVAAANAELRIFKNQLPGEYNGSMFWNSKPVIGNIVLAEVMEFTPETDIVPA